MNYQIGIDVEQRPTLITAFGKLKMIAKKLKPKRNSTLS
jgi:hypothetical protein